MLEPTNGVSVQIIKYVIIITTKYYITSTELVGLVVPNCVLVPTLLSRVETKLRDNSIFIKS